MQTDFKFMTYEKYKTEYGIRLDPAQDAACRETEGHILLLAVPGSGKTTVMTARLGYLVRGKGVSADTVLAVTYSVAGAKEMQKRYERLFGARDVEIRTIHGFCAKIISAYGRACGKKPFSLIDSDGGPAGIIRDILKRCGGYPTDNEVKDVMTAVTYCRNMMLSDTEIDKVSIDGRDFPKIYRTYQAFKRDNRLMDYDDQLFYGYNILCRYPEAVRDYAGRFRYVCVDEAQDTSKLQHMIIRSAAKDCGNLFMVGDEDQSIYGFRAAYPKALLEFDKIYPDAKVLFIEKNYRSTKTVVTSADRFIAANADRRKKHMVTDNPQGDAIENIKLNDLSELPVYIKTAAVEGMKREGKTTAVLCRLNDTLIPVIDLLSEAGIPYTARVVDGLFFTHFIVRDILSFIEFAHNPFDASLFEQLYYKMSAGISRADYEYAVRVNSGEGMLSYPDFMATCPVMRDSVRKRMKKVAAALFEITGATSAQAIRAVLSGCGYGAYLSHRTNDLSKVNTLLAIAERRHGQMEFLTHLSQLKEIITAGRNDGENGIILSTIHSSKGMEFDHVIICDAENGILPSVYEPEKGGRYSDDELASREEDRRLFYVAATRAKEHLTLVTYDRAFEKKTAGFEFVSALIGQRPVKPDLGLPPDAKEAKSVAMNYFVGDVIWHRVFGEGIISAISNGRAEVKFYKHKFPKSIDLLYCIENRLIH